MPECLLLFRTLDTTLWICYTGDIMSKELFDRNKEVEKLYFEGFTLSELAKKFHVSKQRIEQILQYQRQLKIQFRRLSKKDIKI